MNELERASSMEGMSNPKFPVVYDYNGKGTILLSMRERYVCDKWLELGDYNAVMRVVNERFKWRTISNRTVSRWLHSGKVSAYLIKRMEDGAYARGMTKEKWEREAIDFRDGRVKANSTTYLFHKLIGVARGYLVEERPVFDNNIQVNFTQANGER